MPNKNLWGGILAAQLLLAVLLYISHAAGNNEQAVPLLGFATSDINKVVIADGKTTATLGKTGDHWQLTASKLPVNDSKLTGVLDSLAKLTTRWPVVSTAGGRERYEVSDSKFQRHLSLYKDDKLLGDYYFGTSPGLRQTHIRRAGQDDVFALAFNNFELPADDNDWLDKGLLKAADIDHIQGADYELVKKGEDWQLTPQATADATAPDPAKAKALAMALQNLQVLKVAGNVPMGENHSVTVMKGTTPLVYTFTKADPNYYVQRADRKEAFTLSSYDYERIAAVTRSSLLVPPPPPPAKAATATPPPVVKKPQAIHKK